MKTSLSGFRYDGKIYVTTCHTNDRVEAHVQLTCSKTGDHIRYRGRIIQRLKNGYRYEAENGNFSRPCRKAMTALLNVERMTMHRSKMSKKNMLNIGTNSLGKSTIHA